MSEVPFYALRNISHTYRQAGNDLTVLRDICFDMRSGEMVALMGQSGSGKSTLLHIAGLLETPSQGEVVVQGRACGRLSDKDRTCLRRKTLGFVYQFHHLLPEFSAQENLILPQRICGVSGRTAREKALQLLELVGLTHRADHRPACLSGGEQQRVAIARALANDPALLIADEPTGNLDERTGDEVFHLLQVLVKTKNLTVLMATHNTALAQRMDRVLWLHDGELDGDV